MRYPDVKYGKYVLRAIPAKSGKGFEGCVIDHREFGVFTDGTREGLLGKLQHCVRHNVPEFIGYKQAKAQFLQRFPLGFKDPEIGLRRDSELSPKRDAVRLINERLPLQAALDGKGDGKVLAAIMAKPGIFVGPEIAKIRDALLSESGTEMVKVLAQFAAGEVDVADAGKRLVKLKGNDLATWTKITLPAMLWSPAKHALLQPSVSQEFAAAVGNEYRYQSELDASTYRSYLKMLNELANEIRDLEPVDFVDLQTFAHVSIKHPLPRTA